MKYRVELDISFEIEKECLDFIEHVKASIPRPIDAIVPQGPTMTMPKYLRYSECRHDEVPPKPCGPYIMVDLESKTELAARLEVERLAALETPVEPPIEG